MQIASLERRPQNILICFAKDDNNGWFGEFDFYYFLHILPEVIFAPINTHIIIYDIN